LEDVSVAGTIQVEARNPRVADVFPDLLTAVQDVIKKHRIGFDEYRRAIGFLMEAGKSEYELPLLMDVFLAVTVDDVNNPSLGNATESNVEGPFYISGAPELGRPYALPVRDREPGDVLFFSGSVRALDGTPIPGALLDIWQANGEGHYSHFDPSQPEYNLRGKIRTDEQGRFEVRTVVPAPYEIPKQGPTGRLIDALGRHCFRPAHIHGMVSHEGYRPLTTQLYFEDDPWLESDVVGAVKPLLVTKLEKHEDPAEAKARGLEQPFFTCSFDYVLQPAS
jgi:catechol 1,2-dioxygenase